MEITRNQEQFVIMTVLYDELTDFTYQPDEEFRDARDLACQLLEIEDFNDASPYLQSVIIASLSKYGEIVNAFLPYLKNWTWERIPTLTKAILVMSYAHYYYVEKVDKNIVIDVAVNLAKKYVEEKQAAFVNAILDGVIK